MSAILNPTPVQPGVFNRLWVTTLAIHLLPAGNPSGNLLATLLPYDGTYLLAGGGQVVKLPSLAVARAQDPVLDAVVTAALAECERQFGVTGVISLVVQAPDPTRPVVAHVITNDGKARRIADCFALCAQDPVFAQVFTSVMVEIARQADLQIQS